MLYFLLSQMLLHLLTDNKKAEPKIPVAIEKIVRRQNLNFMHNKNQFRPEHFQFMRKLINCNIQPVIDFGQQYHNYSQLVSIILLLYDIVIIITVWHLLVSVMSTVP